MFVLRRAEDRGAANFGWLDSRHSFSFGSYYDPRHMGFRSLRVINDDRVAPAGGFGTHPHDNMEIISYVVSGKLQHRDSMGTGSIISRGDIQLMSAGTGVTHSEFNGSKEEPVRFLQIWLPPAERGLTPSYQQEQFPLEERRDTLKLLISPDGAEGSLTIHRDVRIFGGLLSEGATVSHALGPKRSAWIQVVNGSLRVGEHTLHEGDGVGVLDEQELTLTGVDQGEFLLFDLD